LIAVLKTDKSSRSVLKIFGGRKISEKKGLAGFMDILLSPSDNKACSGIEN
jgi:hypothetical protein